MGADLVQPRARAGRRADGHRLRSRAAAGPRCRRHRPVRRLLRVVRGGGVDRGADRGPVPAGARRRAGPGRVPGAAGGGVRRAPRRRDLGHRRGGRHGGRAGRRWPAHPGVLVAGHLRGPGAVRGAGGAGRARRPRGPLAEPGPAPPGRPAQPDPRPAVGGAHGRAVPACAADGQRLGPLPRGGRAHRVRRTDRGAGRAAAGPAAAPAAPGRGGGGVLPRRRRPGGPRDPAVLPPGLDDRAPGTRGPRARADRRPADLPRDGDAAAAGAARGVDHRRPAPRRGARPGHPHARLHRRPAGRAGTGPGGDHVAGARRAADAGGQDRGGRGPRPRADPAGGSDPRPAPRLRDAGPRAQLERAATWAFRDSFLVGAALALLALLTVVVPHRRRTS